MSKKIKVIIIDDEKLARDIVKEYLQKHNQFELLEECENGFEGLKKINELKPDLIFLDIQMPKLTGFEMLELLDEPPLIIFTTAYDEYALKAFEVNAADYLLKPFSKERFGSAVNKVLSAENENKTIVKKVKEDNSPQEKLDRIVVKKQNDIIIIPLDKILFLEAQDDYVAVHSEAGYFLKQKRMKFYEQNLPEKEFVRIHRSHIINLAHLKKIELIEKDTYHAILKDGKSLPVSKSGYSRLKEIISQ